MPIRRRKEFKERIGGELTGSQLENLILGYSFFSDPFETEDEREKCWRENRDYILSLQGKSVQGEVFGLSNGFYFAFLTRPAAWWEFDAPGPRHFISCGNEFCPYFLDCPVAKSIPTEAPKCVIRSGEDRKGKGSFDGLLKIECVGHDFKIYEPIRESEADFLKRHDLLNEEEEKILEKMAGYQKIIK